MQGKDVNLFQPAAEFLPMIGEVSKFPLCISVHPCNNLQVSFSSL